MYLTQLKYHVIMTLMLSSIFLQFILTLPADAIPDFDISKVNIYFSADNPIEGESVIITAYIMNKGNETQKDIDIRFFEATLDDSGLQIGKGGVIVGLRTGEVGKVEAKWRAKSGQNTIYVIVDPDNVIAESNEKNNQAEKNITGKSLELPKPTSEQIQIAIKNGIEWLNSQQGEFVISCPDRHQSPSFMERCMICRKSLEGGAVKKVDNEKTKGGWLPIIGPGGTALALMALLHSGTPEDDPAVVEGLDYLLHHAPVPDWNQWDDTYDFAVAILALTATGNKDKYYNRVAFATNRILTKQRYKGWGYGAFPDMAHMHYVLLALYAAQKWEIKIPADSLKQAAEWIKSMQREDGGWSYAGIEVTSPWAETSYGSMSMTALMGLKICGVSPTAQHFQRGLEWLKRHYTITSNPGAYEWHYYYLLALQRALTIPPSQEKSGKHNWYEEGAAYLLSQQQPDGRWKSGGQEEPIMSTCFSILFLSKAIPF